MCDQQDDSRSAQIDSGDLQKSVVKLLISHGELSIGSSQAALCAPDPVLTLWVDWAQAHERLVDLCRYQQRLETEMFAMVGPPSASPADWEAADQLLGYSKAKQAEFDASVVEDGLAAALWEKPAHSLVGITAKLHAVLSKGEPSEDSDEYPWPQLRTVLADMLRLGGQLVR
jgi:hypothetical protein